VGVDATSFRAVLGQWPTGVAVITTVVDGEWHGMTASSFSSVSLEPPLVSVCIDRGIPSHDRIARAGVFAVNILGKDHVELGKRFAGASAGADRFVGLDASTAKTGAPVLAEAIGWVDCTLFAAHEAGDHTIFVGEVLAAETPRVAAPLLYHSRAWGQFADVLPPQAFLIGRPEVVVLDAFVRGDAALDEAARLGAPAVCFEDTSGEADPMTVRALLAEARVRLAGVELSVALDDRLGFGIANALTALKSGVARLVVGERLDPTKTLELCTRLGIPTEDLR
jgi:flavin reductase (DIM6/NTAB) family NADH-FMN oxidoreductase RutF